MKTSKTIDSNLLGMLNLDEDFYTLIGAAYVSFGAVHSMLVKRISDASDNPRATQEKHAGRVAGKSLRDINSVFLDINSDQANRIKLEYVIDNNGNIELDFGQRDLRKVPSILGMQFKEIIDDRNRIAHSLVADSKDGIELVYSLKDGDKGVITSDFLNHFIIMCNLFSQQILIYDQMKSDVDRSKTK